MRGLPEELTITATLNSPTRRRSSARAGRIIAVAGLVVLAMVVGVWIPGVVGTAAAALLPWWGLALGVLSVIALVRARRVVLVLLVPILVWVLAIAPSAPGFASGAADQTSTVEIVSQNVRAHSGGAAESAADLAASGADIIALTELDADSLAAARDTLAADYPHSYAIGTVAVWSRLPIADAQALSLGLDWKRALRVVVNAPDADVAVYVMHAASVRPGVQDDRDAMLSGIADAVAADTAESVVVGDFNAASADPALGAVRSQLDWVRPTDGTLGFTWPASLPLARIDHVFVRGATVLESTTVRAGSSDHLATLTTLDF
ncbi:endonuclease/exonuclease/phosphatase family protein [Microbacterium sp. NPDC088619]|uniref:endonuclease/exonuclease/phosphatase family protein n=1 Tax=Microbacterium sp. NPDC088619 TaxID=3364196 RepID=UPI003822A7E6